MKKNGIICLILCIALLFSAQPVSAAEAGADASVSEGCHSVDAAKSLSTEGKMLETSKAVILYERNSDTMIYSYNPDAQIYPSSMVKLMTALVALENGNLTDIVTVTKSALDDVAIGSVSAGLKRGEEISLEALLYCMMAASANDAASVIAEHVGGTIGEFVQIMNEKAAEIGCLSTNYTNVHGLHDEQSYTTARDICRLMDAALENEAFRMLFTADTYTVAATNKSDERVLETTNNMMVKGKKFYDARVTGGKTGSTNQAGRCLVVTAESNGMELLGIVMGAVPTYQQEGIVLDYYGNFEEMKVLLDYGCSGYEYRHVFYDNQVVAQYPVSGGANHVVTRPVSELSTVLPVGIDETKLTWVYEKVSQTISAPVQQGQTIAVAQVWYADVCLVQTDLVAMNDVAVYVAPKIPDAPEKDDSTLKIALIAVGAVLGVALLFVAVLLVLRWTARARMRARQRRRRQNRRRMR